MCSLNQGACGLDCYQCEANIAYRNNDQALREEVAKKWAEQYGAVMKADDVNCSGCMQEGVKIGHCAECEMRACNIKRGTKHCAECDEFSCETIEKFMNMVPVAKENLMKLRK